MGGQYFPPSECVLPAHQRRGGTVVHTRRAVRVWGVNILEDARHWIGLLEYNPSTGKGLQHSARIPVQPLFPASGTHTHTTARVFSGNKILRAMIHTIQIRVG
jgi:hypothetical protein